MLERRTAMTCMYCGRFVGYTSKIHFTPDTAFTAERVEYECAACVQRHMREVALATAATANAKEAEGRAE